MRVVPRELTARLATPAEQRRALEERVAELRKEAADSDSRLVRTESMNVELRATLKQLHASLAERDAELRRATRIASTNAYALGRVQSSINELSRGLTASEGTPAETQASILTRIDGGKNHSFVLRARTTIGRPFPVVKHLRSDAQFGEAPARRNVALWQYRRRASVGCQTRHRLSKSASSSHWIAARRDSMTSRAATSRAAS